jgi:hypothetical protein
MVPARSAGFNEIDLYQGRLLPPEEQIIAMEAYLKGPSEDAAPYNRALGSSGQSHVGEPAAHFLAGEDGFDQKTVVRMQQ